ncbi:hypothetical protein BGZ76_001538, partial [Entomortierella beljakovae]
LPLEGSQTIESKKAKRKMLLSNILDPNKKLKSSQIQEITASEVVSPLNLTINNKEFQIIVKSSDRNSIIGAYDEKILFEDRCSIPSSQRFMDIMAFEFAQHLSGLKSNPLFQRETSKKYVKITDQILDILNQEWDEEELVQSLALQIFGGMIFVNDKNCICIQAAEIYNRNENIDKHRERFDISETSFPENGDKYKVKVLVQRGYPQLIFGTKVFNALVTSYTCTKDGGIHHGPTYDGNRDFSETQVYIQKDVLSKWNLNLTSGILPITGNRVFDLYQLRQVASQFHELSTYLPLRSWNSLLEPNNFKPLTIWTISMYSTKKRSNTSENIGSELFATIAREVFQNKDKATITKSFIQGLIKRTKKQKTTGLAEKIERIGTLFRKNNKIEIIGNTELNKVLQEMAAYLVKSIPRKNESVEKNIVNGA